MRDIHPRWAFKKDVTSDGVITHYDPRHRDEAGNASLVEGEWRVGPDENAHRRGAMLSTKEFPDGA